MVDSEMNTVRGRRNLHKPYKACAALFDIFHCSFFRPGRSVLTATFYYLAFASVISALLAVTRRTVHSMLWVLASSSTWRVSSCSWGGVSGGGSGHRTPVDPDLLPVCVMLRYRLRRRGPGSAFGGRSPPVGLCFASIAWLGRFRTGLAPGTTLPRRIPWEASPR